MAMDIMKEVNRLSGFAVAPGVDIISGQPVKLVDANTITLYDGTGEVLGLALDDTKVFVLADVPTIKAQTSTVRVLQDRPSGDLTPQSLFFSEINRGGKVAVAIDGGVFGIYDDGRGSPYLNDGYTTNGPVYANNSGKLTSLSNAGANPKVGVCLSLGADGILVMKSLL
jgi:hypothetical protein